MRTIVKNDYPTWAESITNSDGVTTGGSGVGFIEAKRFDRDDIYKVRMVNGWRRPVSYYSNDVNQTPLTASHKATYANSNRAETYQGPVTLEDENGRPLSFIPLKAEASDIVWNTLYFQALKKAKDSTMNLAVMLAELGESIHLIGSRSAFFLQLVTLAKAGRWNEVLRQLGLKDYSWKTKSKDFSSRWMELHFGWMPILADIYNVIDLCGKKSRRDGFQVVARATARDTPYVTQIIRKPGVRQGYGVYKGAYLARPGEASLLMISRMKRGHKVNLWFTVSNAKLQTASALGLTNPASVLWEITRLSWFADFFLNIGNWLDALDTLGLTFKGGSKIFWCEQSNEVVNLTSSRKESGNVYILNGGGGSWQRYDTDRRTNLSTPSPFSIRNPFDTFKVITTVALVRQQFR